MTWGVEVLTRTAGQKLFLPPKNLGRILVPPPPKNAGRIFALESFPEIFMSSLTETLTVIPSY